MPVRGAHPPLNTCTSLVYRTMVSIFSLLRTLSLAGALLGGVHAGNLFEELYGGVPKGWRLVRTAKAGKSLMSIPSGRSSLGFCL